MGRKDHKEIGARLRQIREHLVETQTVFAQRFGLSRDDIANMYITTQVLSRYGGRN